MLKVSSRILNSLLQELHDGKQISVVSKTETLLAKAPDSVELLNLRAIALGNCNKYEAAVHCFKIALEKSPFSELTYCNLGNLCFRNGDLNQAKVNYQKAFRLNPKNSRLANNLGTLFKEMSDFRAAEKFYLKAINLDKTYAEPHYNYGVLQRLLNNVGKAEIAYKKALSLRPQYPEALNNLATIYLDFEKTNQAIEMYKMALKNNPNFAQAFFNLCEAFEKKNLIVELKDLLDSVSSPTLLEKEDIKYYHALVSFREKKYVKCKDQCLKINLKKISKKRVTGFLHLKAKAYENIGEYPLAFSAFREMNQFFRNSQEYDHQSKLDYLNRLIKRKAELKKIDLVQAPVQNKIAHNLIFMVGFPRSGTTLLDTILRSHSEVQVLEEMPMVSKMQTAIPEKNTVEKILTMTIEDVAVAQKAYFEELQKHVDLQNSKILVDKLPLNLVEAPLIARVFPKAKFVFVSRHPLDAVLSCFMQNFKLNEAMSNMLDLEDAAKLYDNVMEIFDISNQKFSLETHFVKYEELIEDIESVVKNLLKFLNLEWDDAVLSYQRTALERSEIRTPSYSQVIQPLYNTAKFRWANYADELESCTPVLAPWVTKFGYRI